MGLRELEKKSRISQPIAAHDGTSLPFELSAYFRPLIS